MTSAAAQAGRYDMPMSPPDSRRPAKSILRIEMDESFPSIIPETPTAVGTRKRRAEEDLNEFESPTKRKKSVHFDMSLNMTADIGHRSIELTKKAVRRALENHARGNDEGTASLEPPLLLLHNGLIYSATRVQRGYGTILQ